MIVKSMSRKGVSSIGNIVRYIFKEREVHILNSIKQPEASFLPEFRLLSNLKLTERDVKNWTLSEMEAKLHRLFVKTSTDRHVPEFVNTILTGKLPSNCFSHNIRSSSLGGAISEFNELEDRRIRKNVNMVNVYHDLISFTPEDSKNLNDEKLGAIANKYFELRCSNTAAISTVHRDKGHIHMHFVISGTCMDGTANRMSKQDFQKVKQQVQDYQKEAFPELRSVVKHGSKERGEVTAVKNIKTVAERGSHKAILLEVAERAISHSASVSDFIKNIQAEGHEVYFRNERLQGIKYNGVEKFRFSNLGIAVSDIQQLDIARDRQAKDLADIRKIREANMERQQSSKLDDFERIISEISMSQTADTTEEDNHEDEEREQTEFNDEIFDDTEL